MAKIISILFNIHMKINSINLFSYNSQSNKNINNVILNKKDRQNSINNDLNALEVLGRSQVKFTGIKRDEANEFDKFFYDNLSKNLGLSDKDNDKFKKIVNKFLKTNNLSSTEDLCSSYDNVEIVGSFIENVSDGLDLPAEKVDILYDFFVKQAVLNNIPKMLKEDESLADAIIPIATKSIENNLVCDNLVEKFNLDEKEKTNIYSYLKKLEDDISPEQVAYEITEDYNLSSIDDYNYVLKTIESRDKMFIDYMTENNLI